MDFSRILVRATNCVGDAVMSLPALRAIRERFPSAHIAILARPWVGELYEREPFCDELIEYTAARGAGDWPAKWRVARDLRRRRFDCAVLLPNSFEAGLLVWMAGIPERIGYARDGRGFLLTHAVPVPAADEIPRHERYYYLELLRRSNWLAELPATDAIRLDGAAAAAEAGSRRFADLGWHGAVIGVSPGAAYGSAKRWLPDRFAEAAARLATSLDAGIAIFGAAEERPLCETVASDLHGRSRSVTNFAGRTSLREFIEMTAACRVFLTNDSGAMHIASALGVPTVAVFGATDHEGTGPTGPLARVIREPVECSPCLLRECPIDHRCMTRVTVERVVAAASELVAARVRK